MKKAVIQLFLGFSICCFFVSAQADHEPIKWDEFLYNIKVSQWVYAKQGLSKQAQKEELAKYIQWAENGDEYFSYLLGKIYYDQKQYSKAIKYFTEFSKIHDGAADYYLGNIYDVEWEENIDHDRAIFHYKKVVFGGNNITIRAEAALNISGAYMRRDKDRPNIIAKEAVGC